jgi:hypothetical protein
MAGLIRSHPRVVLLGRSGSKTAAMWIPALVSIQVVPWLSAVFLDMAHLRLLSGPVVFAFRPLLMPAVQSGNTWLDMGEPLLLTLSVKRWL